MTQLARARPHQRPHRDDRLRLDRQGHAAADRAAFRLRQGALRRHRPRGQGPQAARRARHPLHPPGGDPGELPRAADAAADRRAAARASASTCRSTPPRSTSWSSAARSARSTSTPSIEPWPGFYFDAKLGPEARSNYALRETRAGGAPRRARAASTAVSCCGANPGMVSWFVKQALLNLADRPQAQVHRAEDAARTGAGSPRRLGVKGIHIAERDTQRAKQPEADATCSSTPGRSRASCRKACSRPSSAGARTRSGCRRTATGTRPAAAPRST